MLLEKIEKLRSEIERLQEEFDNRSASAVRYAIRKGKEVPELVEAIKTIKARLVPKQ